VNLRQVAIDSRMGTSQCFRTNTARGGVGGRGEENASASFSLARATCF
jgi:hypothetical protein